MKSLVNQDVLSSHSSSVKGEGMEERSEGARDIEGLKHISHVRHILPQAKRLQIFTCMACFLRVLRDTSTIAQLDVY